MLHRVKVSPYSCTIRQGFLRRKKSKALRWQFDVECYVNGKWLTTSRFALTDGMYVRGLSANWGFPTPEEAERAGREALALICAMRRAEVEQQTEIAAKTYSTEPHECS